MIWPSRCAACQFQTQVQTLDEPESRIKFERSRNLSIHEINWAYHLCVLYHAVPGSCIMITTRSGWHTRRTAALRLEENMTLDDDPACGRILFYDIQCHSCFFPRNTLWLSKWRLYTVSDYWPDPVPPHVVSWLKTCWVLVRLWCHWCDRTLLTRSLGVEHTFD